MKNGREVIFRQLKNFFRNLDKHKYGDTRDFEQKCNFFRLSNR